MQSPSLRTLLIGLVSLASLFYAFRSLTTTATHSAPLIMSTKSYAPAPSPPAPSTPAHLLFHPSRRSIIEAAITDNKVVIFSKSYCPYCKKAKAIMAEFDQTPKVFELDLMEDGPEYQAYLTQKTGQRTVPFVYIKTAFIGGSSDVEAKKNSGELKKLLA